jgi:glycosyltransferase involved in cell wall biosynthesis
MKFADESGDDGEEINRSPDSISIVIPCYNEAQVLPLLKDRLTKALLPLSLQWEIIFVDDGSSDRTFEILSQMHCEDARFKILSFSRNFGHQAAILAGLHAAEGNLVAVIDADLQDPPEIISTCVDLSGQGYDVVYAVRRKRKEGLLKRAAYKIFYRLLDQVSDVPIPLDSGDFCLMRRRVVDVIKGMPESNLFVRGLRAWTGFRQVSLEYERDVRAAGETKYPFSKLCRLAADGILSFSIIPLRCATYFGFFAMALSLAGMAFVILWRISGFAFMGHRAQELPGWAAVVGAVLFVSGVQLLMLGVIGESIGRIYQEVKRRPRWVVKSQLGLDSIEQQQAKLSA